LFGGKGAIEGEKDSGQTFSSNYAVRLRDERRKYEGRSVKKEEGQKQIFDISWWVQVC